MLHELIRHEAKVVATVIVAIGATTIFGDAAPLAPTPARRRNVFFVVLACGLFVGAAIWWLP